MQKPRLQQSPPSLSNWLQLCALVQPSGFSRLACCYMVQTGLIAELIYHQLSDVISTKDGLHYIPTGCDASSCRWKVRLEGSARICTCMQYATGGPQPTRLKVRHSKWRTYAQPVNSQVPRIDTQALRRRSRCHPCLLRELRRSCWLEEERQRPDATWLHPS